MFVDGEVNERSTTDGSTLLLEAATRRSFSKQVLSFLLTQGADIRARTIDGSTCLHVYLMHLIGDLMPQQQPVFSKGLEEQQILMDLVEKGADIHARDNYGRSVSDIAYQSRTFDWLPFDTPREEEQLNYVSVRVQSGYVGDLWDSVLVSRGHDLMEFRGGHPRRPAYCESYTRQNFGMLWAGREEMCPYWDDMVYPKGVVGAEVKELLDEEDDPW